MQHFAYLLLLALLTPCATAEESSKSSVLFTNVMVWDGKSEALVDADVVVVGNMIDQVSTEPLAGIASTSMKIIDGGGRTLMPGLIDSHLHSNMYMDGTLPEFQNTTWEEIGARAAAFAQEMLAVGFTTVRDMRGAHDGPKKEKPHEKNIIVCCYNGNFGCL